MLRAIPATQRVPISISKSETACESSDQRSSNLNGVTNFLSLFRFLVNESRFTNFCLMNANNLSVERWRSL